eukprot:scaffold7381_cov310-Pinguiococcus_pyrenoidosus.AAC.131
MVSPLAFIRMPGPGNTVQTRCTPMASAVRSTACTLWASSAYSSTTKNRRLRRANTVSARRSRSGAGSSA